MVVHHSAFAAGDRAGARPCLPEMVALDDLEGQGDQLSR